jgi:hypothetical protein
MNIFEYFEVQLGRAPNDETLKELPVDSGCGDDCKSAIDNAHALIAAIDAAHGLIKHIDNAFGDHEPDLKANVRYTAERVVQCYWRG